MDIKKIIAGITIIMLFAVNAAGAFFFLQKGVKLSREAEEPVLEGVRNITVEAGDDLPDLRKGLKANRAVKDVTVDISDVDTWIPGVYEIVYHYTDISGKKYYKKAACTVTDHESAPLIQEGQRPDGEEKERSREGNAAQEEIKTGDETRIVCYLILAVFSFGVIVWHLRQRYLYR